MKPICLAILMYMVSATAVFSGPFGLEMGQPLNSLRGIVIPNGTDTYILRAVPNPHPAFEFYMVGAKEDIGVCSIGATGRVPSNNNENFDRLRTQLQRNYGFITPIRPNEFGRWVSSRPENFDGVREIRVTNRGGWLSVEYLLSNSENCPVETRVTIPADNNGYYEGWDVL